MPQNRPFTTLFLLMSLDGKISTGDTDQMDFDKDLAVIPGTKKGLYQYYDLEKRTDTYSLNSGRVFEKIGFNKRTDKPQKIGVNFVVIDNKPHLNAKGVAYIAKKAKKLFFVTINSKHPVFEARKKFENIEIFKYNKKVDLQDVMARLSQAGAKRVTIQTGGELNSAFLRAGLIDMVSIVIAPVMIGGKHTPTLVDGESLHTTKQLSGIRALKLASVNKLKDSYLHLKYKVIN